jgi:hypothetical protein
MRHKGGAADRSDTRLWLNAQGPDSGEGPSPVDRAGASWNSRTASGHTNKRDRNVDCASNSHFVDLVDRNPCYFHELPRSSRSDRPAGSDSTDSRSGSWPAPLECKTIAFSRTSPCQVRTSRRRAGCYPAHCAIFRFRLVSRTRALWTVLALSSGCRHFSQVLDG